MNKLTAFPIAILLILVFSCKKIDQATVTPPAPESDVVTTENNRFSAAITSQTITAFISGTIMDEDGKNLAGVSVVAGGATVTTNDKGYFQFPASVTVNKDYATITATLNGYFKATRTFTPNASGKANHYFEIKLLKPSSEKTVAASGGNVVLDNKVDITFPDAAVVTAAGTAYNGQYKVVARYIDPASADFLQTMPGMLAGLNDQNQMQALQSFGMAIVELRDASGNPLQLAPGKKATLKLPAPANSPATIPLWHFNEKYGLWIQAGTATKTGDSYVAEVNHFSTWNLDLESNSFKLDVQFKDQLGNALAGLRVEAYMDGLNKIKSFYTDNEGKATLVNAPASKSLTIKIFFQCDTTVKTVDPVTADRSETITVPGGSGVKSYTITGKLTGCDNTPLVNQPFKIAIQGDAGSLGLPGVTDAQGSYTVTGMICNTSNSISVQASALIDNEYRYAAAVNTTSVSSTYNAQVCDTTTSIADNFEIIFPDYSLDSLIRVKINKPTGTILYGDVKNIDSISGFRIISDLSGIQFCTNLRILELRQTYISDLGPLRNLLNLQRLVMSVSNGLSDISPLQNLTQLQSLNLSFPSLTDISPLQNLANLQSLYIQGTNLSDINPIRTLTQIKRLWLFSHTLRDLSPLQNFTGLISFTIGDSSLLKSDLDVLSNFAQLDSLEVGSTSISDFSIVKDLPRLRHLSLIADPISDVSQFALLTNLTSLELVSNNITDITDLQTLTQLQRLTFQSNQVSDISSLRNMTQLTSVALTNNLISDVSPLQNLTNLKTLWLDNNQISNVTPLINGVPNLTLLQIFGQQQGTISQAQQTAFANTHPGCFAWW